MTLFSKEFVERQTKIKDALEEVGLGDLEAKLSRGSDLAWGSVRMELYKDGQMVGEILYYGEPPVVSFSDNAYDSYYQKLRDYFKTH